MALDTDHIKSLLSSGYSALGLTVSETRQNQLFVYLEQLIRWNKAYNLSGIKNPEQMVSLHILDSLTLVPHIQGELVLDVGTGAGLPGFPLAIFYPEIQFKLIDSNSKKTRFIFQTAASLGLDNIEAVHSRVESYAIPRQVDIVLSRAFSSLADFVKGCRHLAGPKTRLMAMKGLYPAEEIAELPEDYQVTASHKLNIPGENLQRHLLEMTMIQNQQEKS